jgi:hypothetical protein
MAFLYLMVNTGKGCYGTRINIISIVTHCGSGVRASAGGHSFRESPSQTAGHGLGRHGTRPRTGLAEGNGETPGLPLRGGPGVLAGLAGGGAGIRTLGGLHLTRFRGVLLRPLGHATDGDDTGSRTRHVARPARHARRRGPETQPAGTGKSGY